MKSFQIIFRKHLSTLKNTPYPETKWWPTLERYSMHTWEERGEKALHKAKRLARPSLPKLFEDNKLQRTKVTTMLHHKKDQLKLFHLHILVDVGDGRKAGNLPWRALQEFEAFGRPKRPSPQTSHTAASRVGLSLYGIGRMCKRASFSSSYLNLAAAAFKAEKATKRQALWLELSPLCERIVRRRRSITAYGKK